MNQEVAILRYEQIEKNENISFLVNLQLSKFSLVEALGTKFPPRCGKWKCPLGGGGDAPPEKKEN